MPKEPLYKTAKEAFAKGHDFLIKHANEPSEVIPQRNYTMRMLDRIKNHIQILRQARIENNLNSQYALLAMWQTLEKTVNFLQAWGTWQNIDTFAKYSGIDTEIIPDILNDPRYDIHNMALNGENGYEPPYKGLYSVIIDHGIERYAIPKLFESGMIDKNTKNDVKKIAIDIRKKAYIARDGDDYYPDIDETELGNHRYDLFKKAYTNLINQIPDRSTRKSFPKLIDENHIDVARTQLTEEYANKIVDINKDDKDAILAIRTILKSMTPTEENKNAILDSLLEL